MARPGGWEALSKVYSNPVPADVIACMEEMGLQVTRVVDGEAHAKCPAHFKRLGKEDRHPSFSVNIEEGVFGCFSCQFGGRFFFRLVMEVLGLSRTAALDWCRERGGVHRARSENTVVDGLVFAGPVDTSHNINEASLALYVDVPADRAAGRGLSVLSCNHYGVRWDEENERWIVPIREPGTDRLLGWQEKSDRYFRNVPRQVRKGQTLFGLNQCRGDTVVVLESPLDVVRMHTAGYGNAVSTYGANVTDAQLGLIVGRFACVVWAMDNDTPGVSATADVLRRTAGLPIIPRVLDYTFAPGKKDIGAMRDVEIYRCVEGAKSALTRAV